jgi:hypothetical protein
MIPTLIPTPPPTPWPTACGTNGAPPHVVYAMFLNQIYIPQASLRSHVAMSAALSPSCQGVCDAVSGFVPNPGLGTCMVVGPDLARTRSGQSRNGLPGAPRKILQHFPLFHYSKRTVTKRFGGAAAEILQHFNVFIIRSGQVTKRFW